MTRVYVRAGHESSVATLAIMAVKMRPQAQIIEPSAEATAEQIARSEELTRCAASFRYFLRYWHFRNRETGEDRTFEDLWQGQAELADLMEDHEWIFALKAGKLGFSELACAYDGWVARFGHPNARVHLFSYSGDSARDIFEWVRYGLDHLPDWMRLSPIDDEAGADNSRSLKLYGGPDDKRRIIAYNTGRSVSIDQTCSHAHLDEFARWPSEEMWAAIQSTIAPLGSCHIITRGRGPNYAAKVYDNAKRGIVTSQSGQQMRAFFAPFDRRPGRTDAWLEAQAASFGRQSAIWQFAPRTDREALQGDDTYVYPQYENPPGRHRVPAHPCPLAENQKIAIGVDPGGVHPTAMGVWGERSSGRRHLYAEFYEQHSTDDAIESWIVAQWTAAGSPRGGKVRVFVPPDEPTLLATLAAHLRRYGIMVAQANTDIDEGIRTCGRYLNDNAMTIHDGCANHDNEFRDYRNTTIADKATKVEYAGERPIKHHADAMDAMRYAHLGLSQWITYRPMALPGGRTVMGR